MEIANIKKRSDQVLLDEKTVIWEQVNRMLVRKTIQELAHELVLQPQTQSQGENKQYQLISDNPAIIYEFKATKYALDHWDIEPTSIVKYKNDNLFLLNMLEFIQDFQETLAIPEVFLPTYIEEILSTLSGAYHKYIQQKWTSAELITKDFQTIEHAMTEGHPCFIANNGRIGFDAVSYQKYAPESDTPFQLIWLAGHTSKTTFTAITGFEYTALMQKELGAKTIAQFNMSLEKMGLSIEDYLFIPVHPWQWNNKIQQLFIEDIISHDLVYLGTGDDVYSAQQSIRTLYNQSQPKKCYTKTALSILNMGFVRGLSSYYMKSTPAITKWVNELLATDPYLQSTGFTMLDEAATIGYENERYAHFGASNVHNKLLAALWRESPHIKTMPNQQLMTMAALLHVDTSGNSFLAHKISVSGLETGKWISKYLHCYLSPLLHCFYQYELLFMPHGENVILVMEDHIPVKMLMKDITEEVILFDKTRALPEKVARLYTETRDSMKVLAIFTDVFDCFFRFMAPLLDAHLGFTENKFWQCVANCIYDYQEIHPELSEKFIQFDLFVPEFDRCCLNRLQLKNTKQMLNLSDPIESLIMAGTLQNPLKVFRRAPIDLPYSGTEGAEK